MDGRAEVESGREALNAVGDKLEMFDRFATIEDEFEPLETMIDDTVVCVQLTVLGYR